MGIIASSSEHRLVIQKCLDENSNFDRIPGQLEGRGTSVNK